MCIYIYQTIVYSHVHIICLFCRGANHDAGFQISGRNVRGAAGQGACRPRSPRLRRVLKGEAAACAPCGAAIVAAGHRHRLLPCSRQCALLFKIEGGPVCALPQRQLGGEGGYTWVMAIVECR